MSGGCTQCKPGMGLINNKCLPCGTGSVVNPKTQKCMKVGVLPCLAGSLAGGMVGAV